MVTRFLHNARVAILASALFGSFNLSAKDALQIRRESAFRRESCRALGELAFVSNVLGFATTAVDQHKCDNNSEQFTRNALSKVQRVALTASCGWHCALVL